MASSGDSMVSGAEKDREHWRFVSAQTRGCLSVTRRSDKQREQQLQLAGYLAMRECGVVGMGDTRLGGDASDIARLTRTALNGLYNNDTNTADCGGATGPAGREQSRPSAATYNNDTNTERGTRPGQDPVGHGAGVTNPAGPDSNIYDNTNIHNNNTNDDEDGTRPPAGQSANRPRLRVGLTYDAAGSHKTANGVWRGGVLLGSLGEANTRMEGRTRRLEGGPLAVKARGRAHGGLVTADRRAVDHSALARASSGPPSMTRAHSAIAHRERVASCLTSSQPVLHRRQRHQHRRFVRRRNGCRLWAAVAEPRT